MITKKGFTLFTALISLLLVSVALALIFNMITTEETYLELIQDQSSMSDLMTMGDIARADAFNTFIITLRSSWEEHKTNYSIDITRSQMDMNWDDFTQWYIKDNFFERDFAGYFASGILHNLRYSANPPGYNITTEIKTGSHIECDNDCNFGNPNCTGCEEITTNEDDYNLFKSVVIEMFTAGGERADIIDCNQNMTTCNGSFFLTLDTTQLSDENYELLPIITVLKTKTDQVIQRPVLSRQIYKIYIPWRGLQALRVARNLVLSNEAEKNMYPAITNGTGMFSPTIHNTLEQARLGFCDPYYCTPRSNFFSTPESKTATKKCETIPKLLTVSGLPSTLNVSNLPGLPQDYSLDSDTSKSFLELYKQTFIQSIVNRPGEIMQYNSGLVMNGNLSIAGSTNNGDINIFDINIEVNNKISKAYRTTPGVSVPDPSPPVVFNNLTADIGTIVGGLGLFLQNNKSVNIADVDHEWYNANKDQNASQNDAEAIVNLECAEFRQATISLEFKENDPRYRIKDSYQSGETKIQIKIHDDYFPFYFPPGNLDQSWSPLSANMSTGYLNSDIIDDLEDANTDITAAGQEQAWACYSQINIDDTICSPKTE